MLSVIVGVCIGTIMESERLGYQIFEDYENEKFIYKNEQKSLINYLCGNINAYWNPNRWYYYEWYNESSNLCIVTRWQKQQGQPKKGKYGERICYNRYSEGEIIDLTDPNYKDHCKICYRCNSLNAVKL